MEKVIPILNCKDLRESINFYRDRLGFDAQVESWDEAGRPSVAHLAREGVEFRASQDRGDPGSERARELRLKEPGVAVDLYINLDDVDAEYRLLTSRGVRTQGPPEDRFWGERTFTAFDPDGYRLTFAQRVVETAAEVGLEEEEEITPVPGPAVRSRPTSPPATTPARTPKEPAGPKPEPPREPVGPRAKRPAARRVAASKKPKARKAAVKKPARAKAAVKKQAPGKAAKKAKKGTAGRKVAPSRPPAKPGSSAAGRRGPRSTPPSRASQSPRKRAGTAAQAKQSVRSARKVTSPVSGRKKATRARRG